MPDLLSYLIVLIGIGVWIGNRGLKKRLADLAKRVDALQAQIAGQAPVVSPIAAPSQPADAPILPMAAPLDAAPSPEQAIAPDAPLKPTQPVPTGETPRDYVVLSPDRAAQLAKFLQRNWVYVVSALSLALAGLFLVQYGIENGLLTPWMRVVAALVLGGALVTWGERLRRRGGLLDSYLPATFSGAGLVVIFAAILAARQLYDLIGPAPTLLGLIATAILAIGLGWFHGALLMGLGLIGAAAAPFLTGGEGAAPTWFYGYFGLVAAIGLAVDTLRRWAWVSVLALALAFVGGALSLNFGAGYAGWTLLLLALPVLATILPERSLIPRQAGPSFTETAARSLPPFPVRLVAGTLAAASVLVLGQIGDLAGPSTLALLALAGLVLLWLIWTSAAPGLADLALMPAVAFLVALVVESQVSGQLWRDFTAQAIAVRPPESGAPWTVTWIMALGAAMTLAGITRALTPGPLARWQGMASVIFAGLLAGVLQVFWQPDLVLGAFPWAMQIMGLAVLTGLSAPVFARRDGTDHHRAAMAALVSLSLIALSLAMVASGTPLTLALCALIVVAAALDARFDLWEMTLFVQAGAAVVTYRMLVDPGVIWASHTPYLDFLASFLGPIAAGLASLRLLVARPRVGSTAVLESAAALWVVGLLDAQIFRWLDAGADRWLPDHLIASLFALPWLGNMVGQIYRRHRSPALRRLRLALAWFSGIIGFGLMGLAVTVLNPLSTGRVLGPVLVNSLTATYALPGLALLAAGLWMPGSGLWVKRGLLACGSGLTLLFSALEIRHICWGSGITADQGVLQGELYTYTLAMMLLGAALLMAALARHSAALRRAAMAVIALTIVKVFLFDAAGLTGLTRVVSFLGLGLSLAGLAWLNAWVDRATRAARPATSGPADPPAAP